MFLNCKLPVETSRFRTKNPILYTSKHALMKDPSYQADKLRELRKLHIQGY